MSFYDSDDDDVNEIEDQEILHTPPTDGDKSCPICLNSFSDQQIGVPNSCEHVYCIDCILQWTKKTSTCPLDRIKIQHLCVYKFYGGPFSCEIKVKETIKEEFINPLAIVSCEVCGSGDNEDTLLLCDGCDKGYHCACLTPPLSEVPSSEWFCDHCMLQLSPAETVSPSVTRPRRVGRTSITEQIRNEITRNRSNIRTLNIGARNEFDAIIEAVLRGASRHVEVTKKRRRRKNSRKRGRGVKKSRKEKQDLPSGSSDRCSPPQLSIRGERNILYNFETSLKTQDTPADYVIAQKHRMLSRSAIRFNAPLPSLLLPSLGVTTSTPAPPPPPNLLETIFNDQDLLVAPASQVTISSNGSWKRRHENAKTRQSASSDQPESSTNPGSSLSASSGSSSAPKSSSSAPSGSSSNPASSAPVSSLSVPDSSSSTESSNQNTSNTFNGSQSLSNQLSSITKDQSNLYDPFQPTLSDEDEPCRDLFSCNDQQFKNQNNEKISENTKDQVSKDNDAEDKISKDKDTKDQSSKDENTKDQIPKDEDTKDQISKDEETNDQISKDEDAKDQISKDEDQVFKDDFCKRSEKVELKTKTKNESSNNDKKIEISSSRHDDVTNSKRDDVTSKKSHPKKKSMKRKTSRSRDRTQTSRSKSRDRHERKSSRSVSRDRRRHRNRSREDAKRSGKRKRRSRSVSSSSRDRKKYKNEEKSKKKQKRNYKEDGKSRSRKKSENVDKKEAVMTSEPSVDYLLDEAFESKVTSSPRASNKKEEKKHKRATSQSSDEKRRRRRSNSSNSNSSRRRRKRSSRRRSTSRDRSYYNRRSSRKRRDSPRINNRSRHRRSSPVTSSKTASIDPAFFKALEKSKNTSEHSIAPITDVTSPKPITTLTGVASNDVKISTNYLFHDEADRALNDVPSMSSTVRSALIEIPVVDSIAPTTSSTRNDKKVKSDENGKKLADDVTAISRKSKDAISNILNIAGMKPMNAGGTRATIMSIAELTKQLDLPPLLTSGTNTLLQKFNENDSNKEADGLSPVSIDNIESSAVDMYNRGKQRQLLKKKEFQAAVVEAAKVAIKPSYENREISKAQYKDIMKKAVNKVCQADKTMEVNPIKIRRLIRRYVDIHKSKNEKNKEKMRNELDHQRSSKRKSSGSRKKSKKQQPITEAVSPSSNQSINLQSTTLEDTKQSASDSTAVVEGLSLLKRQPRKIVTLPDLPLPPPPPPPRPSGYKL